MNLNELDPNWNLESHKTGEIAARFAPKYAFPGIGAKIEQSLAKAREQVTGTFQPLCLVNNFAKLDAQDEMSRLAQIQPDEVYQLL